MHDLTQTQRRRSRFHARLLYGLSLATAAYGLSLLHPDPNRLLNSATWLGIAGLLTGIGVLLVLQHTWPVWLRFCQWAHARGVRLPVLLLALGLGTLTATRFALRLEIGGTFVGYTIVLWICSWLLLLVATWPVALHPFSRLRTYRWELLGVVLVTLIAAGLRFYALGQLPRVIDGDEGVIGLWALDAGVSVGVLTTPFAAMDGVGVLYLFLIKGLFTLFGPEAFALRLLPAIAGTLAIPATYLLARHVLGIRAAVVAMSLLTVAHVHLHFSRTVAVSYTYATLFVPLALYCLLSGLERRSPFRLALSVLLVGLHINVYVDAWVWLVLLFLLLGAYALIDRRLFEGNALSLAVFGAALLIVLSPMLIWAWRDTAAFGARLAVDGTFTSGWLTHEAQATGKHEMVILAKLLWLALGTFTHRPFQDFYFIGVPTLGPVTRLLWLPGLLIALWRTWDHRIVTLNGWFWGGVVALGVVTVPPSTYHYRLLVVLPAACMLAGLAFDTLWRRLARSEPRLHNIWWQGGILVALVITVAYLNLNLYYGQFLGQCKFFGVRTRSASLFGHYLGTLPHETRAFILPTETSLRYGPHRSLDFLSGRMQITNLEVPLGSTAPAELAEAAAHAPGIVVAAVPERRAELVQFQHWLPGGTVISLTDCGAEILTVYAWKP